METTEILTYLGEKLSSATQWSLIQLSSMGMKTGIITSKIITLIILLLVGFLVIKLGESMKGIIKVAVICLLVLLIVSIVFSFGI